MKAGVLTISDRGAQGVRADLGGPGLRNWLREQGVDTIFYEIIPDEIDQISAKLCEWADEHSIDLILTTGGTGVSPRDVTPEATAKILDRTIPGFGEQMRAESLKITPMAILSRAIAGVRKQTLIINLPGNPKAAIENLDAVWAAIPHAVAKIQGSQEECANISLK